MSRYQDGLRYHPYKQVIIDEYGYTTNERLPTVAKSTPVDDEILLNNRISSKITSEAPAAVSSTNPITFGNTAANKVTITGGNAGTGKVTLDVTGPDMNADLEIINKQYGKIVMKQGWDTNKRLEIEAANGAIVGYNLTQFIIGGANYTRFTSNRSAFIELYPSQNTAGTANDNTNCNILAQTANAGTNPNVALTLKTTGNGNINLSPSGTGKIVAPSTFQAGTVGGGSQYGTVTFPTAFPATPTVTAQVINNQTISSPSEINKIFTIVINGVTTTGFKYKKYFWDVNSPGNPSNWSNSIGEEFYWQAILP